MAAFLAEMQERVQLCEHVRARESQRTTVSEARWLAEILTFELLELDLVVAVHVELGQEVVHGAAQRIALRLVVFELLNLRSACG
jgi:hypothetical protein